MLVHQRVTLHFPMVFLKKMLAMAGFPTVRRGSCFGPLGCSRVLRGGGFGSGEDQCQARSLLVEPGVADGWAIYIDNPI